MEEKFKQFQAYDWENSTQWHEYYVNLFPTPSSNKLDRYKRKFYKLKIDQGFDINYKVNSDSSASNDSSNSTSSNSNINNQKQSNQQNQHDQNFQPSNPIPLIDNPTLFTIETILFFSFFPSFPLNFYSRGLCVFAFLLRTIRFCGIPEISSSYMHILLSRDSFHMLIYSLLIYIDRFNYYPLIPLGLSALIYFCENAKKISSPYLSFAMKYIDIIISKKGELFQYRANVEVVIGFMMILGAFVGINSFIIVILYWQYMRMKYLVNPNIKNSFTWINQYANNFKNNEGMPYIVKVIIEKVQLGMEYFGNSDQNGENGLNCNIF